MGSLVLPYNIKGKPRGPSLVNKLKTHCKRGHELKGENLLKYGFKVDKRLCKICARERNKQESSKLSQKKYYQNNKEKRKLLRLKWKQEHPEYFKDWNKNNRDKYRKYYKTYYRKNTEKRKLDAKIRYQKNPDYQKQWRKNNPRSNDRNLDVRDIMNNVRLRDKNTCQWQGCGLTFKQAPIHVHHIFPRNEYPELELIEEYMICYCLNHHWLWHKYRGDRYANLISLGREKQQELIENR